MDPVRFDRLQIWFATALELGPVERQLFLESVEDLEPQLVGMVGDMLANQQSSDDFWERIIDNSDTQDKTDPLCWNDDEAISKKVGPFQLLERLGAGGMGVVYLAEQKGAVQRIVALKLLGNSKNLSKLGPRFALESGMLAQVNHPNVAHLYEVGASDEGIPYFAMEYIDGAPLTAWCNQQKNTIAQRLELFLQVCEGLTQAHQKGIIHRDLKPDNILVTTHGAKATPKIIDFGIARPTDLSRKEWEADPASQLGTLSYLSPDRFDSTTETDVRTDIYSMGAILFELLTGSPIRDPEALAGASHEERKRLMNEDPPVSGVFLGNLRNLEAIAANRSTTPQKLLKQVNGDLEAIVAKALARNKDDRYATAAALAGDINNYLKNKPVDAMPHHRRYLLQKYYARHRLGANMAFAVVAIFLLSFVAVTHLWLTAENARQRAARALDNEKDIRRLLTQFIEESHTDLPLARSKIRFEEMEQILARTPPQSRALRMSIHQVLGRAAYAWGLYDEAIFYSEAALLDVKGFPDYGSTCFDAMDVLARAHRRLGYHVQAKGLFEQLLKHLPQAGQSSLRIQNELISTLTSMGKLADAEEKSRRLLTIQAGMSGVGTDMAQTMTGLGNILTRQKKFEEAELFYRKAHALQKQKLGPRHPQTLATLNNLANVLAEQHIFHESEEYYRQALDARECVLYPYHSHTLSSRHGLARVLYYQNRIEEADVHSQIVFHQRLTSLGPHHSKTLAAMLNMAAFYGELGLYQRAEVMLLRLMDSYEKQGRPNHPRSLLAANNRGNLYIKWGRAPEAILMLQKTLARKERALGKYEQSTLNSLCTLAEAHQANGDLEAAFYLFEQTTIFAGQHLNRRNTGIPIYHGYLAQCLISMNRLDEAEDHLLFSNAFFEERRKMIPDWLCSFWEKLDQKRELMFL